MKAGSEIKTVSTDHGVIFNIYPDSCGGNLAHTVNLLAGMEFKDAFSHLYILPSMFKSDLDRGFSVISYELNDELADGNDLENLEKLGLKLKLDFVLNHLSVLSPQFQDLIEKGDDSEYKDFFMDWNRFWEGLGVKGKDGYIIPDNKYADVLFMRKPGYPVLKVPFPDGSSRFYWNTFYRNITYRIPEPDDLLEIEGMTAEAASDLHGEISKVLSEKGHPDDIIFGKHEQYKNDIVSLIEHSFASLQGQMDLNGESEAVWKFYEATVKKLKNYGAEIIRLDAFAYLHKQAGLSNFFNEPGTWNYLSRIQSFAEQNNVELLPEIHSAYSDRLHEKLAGKGYCFYDFFFPGLIIHTMETGKTGALVRWIKELVEKGYRTVNMLGCHDGIPVLDLKGLLSDVEIDELIRIITSRGGRIKDIFDADGKRISYYQVNAAFFSALDESCEKLLLARAVQMFMPGIPQVWYLDLFAGTNDYEAADRFGHKDINRTNLSLEKINQQMSLPVVKKQLELIRLRNTFPAFKGGAVFSITEKGDSVLNLKWERKESTAEITADFRTMEFRINLMKEDGQMHELETV